MLSDFKEKLNAPKQNGKKRPCHGFSPVKPLHVIGSDVFHSVAIQSTTPTGTPPQNYLALSASSQQAMAAPQVPDTSEILKNLQALAGGIPANVLTAQNGGAVPPSSNNIAFPNGQQNMSSVNLPPQFAPAPASAVIGQPPMNAGFQPYGGMVPNMFGNGQQQGLAMPAAAPVPNPAQNDLTKQLQILAMLKAQNIPQEQWPSLLQVLMGSSAPVGAPNVPTPTAQGAYPGFGGGGNVMSRDSDLYDHQMRSPGRYRNGRSRSPTRDNRRRDASPQRRRSPVYGDYGDRNDRDGRRGDRNRGGRGDHHRRSPDRNRRSPSPRQDYQLPLPGPKWIQYDPSLGKDMIKGIPFRYMND